MKLIYFDTETTGVRDAQICQLSYIIDNGIEVYGKNHFFSVTDMNIYAEGVHGFSKDRLDELSCGRVFKDTIDEIEKDFDGAMLIAHNAKFDIKMMSEEYKRLGRVFAYDRSLCTMRYMTQYLRLPKSYGRGYKAPSLKELVAHYIMDETIISEYVNYFFGVDSSYHDARYDTTALYMAFSNARDDIQELKEIVCSLV